MPKSPDERDVAWSSDPAAPKGPAPRAAPPPAPAGGVRVRLERQGRGGKVVSVVENLPGHPAAIDEIARSLKSACGAGGTVKGRVVEIQGDHRERIVAVLASLGISAKRVGG